MQIYEARARLSDKVGMKAFLKPIPHSDELALIVTKGTSGRTPYYDKHTNRLYYIGWDGTTIGCWTVTDIQFDQAVEIAAACDSEITTWNMGQFEAIVERVLDVQLDLVN